MTETFKLLWRFKWYIAVYLFFYCLYIMEYFSPPAEDLPLWDADVVKGDWAYTNQKVYIGSMKMLLVEFFLLFIIGTSNMRNHPLLAKFIFLFPLLSLMVGTFILIIEDMLGY